MAAIQVSDQDSEYYRRFYGRFAALRHWDDLSKFWDVLKAQPEGWYIYAPGEPPPSAPVDEEKLNTFIAEMDELLRREHDEDYCNIVYVDDRQSPDFIKIYDPNNLGVSCGFSDNPPLPGWVLSRLQPIDMPSAIPQPGNRKRWWKKIFGG
ncbi:MAG: hypothetical protein ACWA5X_08635 [bacterium]